MATNEHESIDVEQLAGAKQRAQAALAELQEKYPGKDLMAWYWLAFSSWDEVSASYVLYLVEEIERLRTEVAGLRHGMMLSLEPGLPGLLAENASMRPIVEAVANTHGRLHCAVGCRSNDRWNKEDHRPDCLITRARAFVAQHPAQTGESETE